MHVCTFINRDGRESVGVVKGESIIELPDYKDMVEFIGTCDPYRIQKSLERAERAYDFGETRFMAPVTNPEKMIFVGLNYRDHARETNSPIPEYPILFSKFRNSLIGHNENIVIPGETKKCDYEAELAFIVGRTARNIRIEDAMQYVFGYTICNDVSARDLQKRVSQWLSGKSADTFAPMGPVIVTADEIEDPHNLNIGCRINGVQRQKSNTRELIFTVPYLLSYISRTITLQPGDIISTGTPSGVALGMENPVWLKEGDICEIEVEGIGILRNGIVNGE